MDKDSFLKRLDDMISSIFSSAFGKEEEKEEKTYEGPRSIQEYTQSTGKRFRVTKDQKERGLSREEAFKESMISSYGFVDF
jgi:hypothetical protein